MWPVCRYRAPLPPLTTVLRALDASVCTTTCALSHRAAPPAMLAIVKSSAFPPGKIWGPCACSPSLTVASCLGAPPFVEQLKIPLTPWPIRRSPAESQAIPYGNVAGQIVTAAPPPTAMRLTRFSPKTWNAIERPSGENVGLETSDEESDPGIACASNSESNRRKMRLLTE